MVRATALRTAPRSRVRGKFGSQRPQRAERAADRRELTENPYCETISAGSVRVRRPLPVRSSFADSVTV